jgi:hypothetical protein
MFRGRDHRDEAWPGNHRGKNREERRLGNRWFFGLLTDRWFIHIIGFL